MLAPLVLSLFLSAPPVVKDGTVEGKPIAEACSALKAAGEAIVEVGGGHEWQALEPTLAQVRGCGVTRLALRVDDGEPVWMTFERGDDPVVVVGQQTHVVDGGAAAPTQLDRQAPLFWRAFPAVTRPCISAAPRARVRSIAESTAALTRGAGDRMVRVCLMLADDVESLPPAERTVVDLLRGGDGGPPGPTGDGHLTRWFGRSVAPVAEEQEVPRWTRITNQLCRTGGTAQIWGVGSVKGIRNHALARTTADNRARAAIAAFIQTDISRSKHGVKTFTAQTLSGVQVVDHFFATDGKVFALATMTTQQKAKEPCPTGSEVVRSWRWRGLDPTGGFGSEKPAWARQGLSSDADSLWVTVFTRSPRPLAESTSALETLARSRLTAALAQGALQVASGTRSDTGEDCLLAVPWDAASAAAPVETWFDVGGGGLFARASLDLAEVRGALGPGCPQELITELVAASRRDFGSSSVATPTIVPAKVDYPEWVLRGTGAAGTNNRVFYGVGSVSGIKNHALARTTADNRARAEIAKMFEVFSAMLMRDYMNAQPRQPLSASTEEQHVGMAIKTFSAVTLSGVQIVDHWFHPDGTVYALAQLDLDHFEKNLGKMKELNKRVRDYVRKNAERVHKDLAREAERRR